MARTLTEIEKDISILQRLLSLYGVNPDDDPLLMSLSAATFEILVNERKQFIDSQADRKIELVSKLDDAIAKVDLMLAEARLPLSITTILNEWKNRLIQARDKIVTGQ